MHSLIRTYTFLKYAETQLESARLLLEDERLDDVAVTMADVATTISKAFSSALPNEQRNLYELNKTELSEVISDLTFSSEEAREISGLLLTVRSNKVTGEMASDEGLEEARERFLSGKRLLDMVSKVFPARPDRLN